MNHIVTFKVDMRHKYESCVEAKLGRSSFQKIERKTKSLDLIYSDIYDFKFKQLSGGNKYFITFIDDCTKFCYVYLIKKTRMNL